MDIDMSGFAFDEFNSNSGWNDPSLQLFGDVTINDEDSESLSPLSNSQGGSPLNIDRQVSLLTDRPDTPLDSVCNIGDLSSNDFLQDYNSQSYPLFDGLDEQLDNDTKMYFNSVNDVKQETKCDMDDDILPTMVPTNSTKASKWYQITDNKLEEKEITSNIKVEETNDTFLYNHSPAVLQAKQPASLIEFKTQGIKRKLPQVFLCEPSMKASAVNMSTTNGGPKLTIKRFDTKPQPLKQVTTTSGLRVGHLVEGPELKATSFPSCVNVPKNAFTSILKNGGQLLPNIRIKTEPGLDMGSSAQFLKVTPQQQLPPTPPSSSSSDSEHSSPRAVKQLNIKQYQASNGKSLIRIHSNAISQASLTSQMLSSNQRLNQSSGPLDLTEEEKKTLQAEGYDIPTSFPLSKVDERNLKKVRRKIKNKISAQESRRKKKEYLEALEKQMDRKEEEANCMKRKVKDLEEANSSLMQQVRNLQQLLTTKSSVNSQHTQTSSCMMMLCLSFVFFVSGWLPILDNNSANQSFIQENQEDPNQGGVILPYQEDVKEEMIQEGVSPMICDVDKFFNNDYKGRVIKQKKVGVGNFGGTKLPVVAKQQLVAKQLVTKRESPQMVQADLKKSNLVSNINVTGGQQQAVTIINVEGGGKKKIINAARRTLHDNQGKRLEVLIPLTKNVRKFNLK